MQGNQLFGTLKSVLCREVYYIPVSEGPLIGGFAVVTAVHNVSPFAFQVLKLRSCQNSWQITITHHCCIPFLWELGFNIAIAIKDVRRGYIHVHENCNSCCRYLILVNNYSDLVSHSHDFNNHCTCRQT